MQQELCSEKKRWDDDLSEQQKSMWLRWRQELPLLEQFEVQRCYKPKYFGEIVSATLHNFQMHHKKAMVKQAIYILLMIKGTLLVL